MRESTKEAYFRTTEDGGRRFGLSVLDREVGLQPTGLELRESCLRIKGGDRGGRRFGLRFWLQEVSETISPGGQRTERGETTAWGVGFNFGSSGELPGWYEEACRLVAQAAGVNLNPDTDSTSSGDGSRGGIPPRLAGLLTND